MNYLRKSYLKLLILFFLALTLIIYRLKTSGGGYRPGVIGGSGPWTWTEIFENFYLLFIAAIIVPLVFAYFDYMSIKKENEKKELTQNWL